jgi:hypothetical protein
LIKSFALYVFHYQEEYALRALTEVRYIDDVGVPDRGRCACLALKTRDGFPFLQVFVAEYVRADSLHRYAARYQILVPREIDLAHGASTQPLLEQVTLGKKRAPGQSVFGVCRVLRADEDVILIADFATGALAHDGKSS